MAKYIDAEKLKELLDEKYKEFTEKAKKDCPLQYQYMADGLDIAEQFIDSLQQEQPGPTCKSCGFYENNCPFIRNTFKPYPNMICKDYTYSVMKQQEQPKVDFKIEERKWVHDAVDNIFPEDGDFMSEVDFRKILKDTAHHFYELGLKAKEENK